MQSERQSRWNWWRQMRNGEEICLLCSLNLWTNVFCPWWHPCGTLLPYLAKCYILCQFCSWWRISLTYSVGTSLWYLIFFFFSLAKNQIGLHRWWHPSKAGISCALAVEEAVGVQHVSARQPVPHFRAFLGLLLLMLLSAVWVLPREQKHLLISPV